MATGPFRLHVAVDRGHGPVYVLLHGINSTGHDWDTVVTAMGFDRRCVAVDELGYGESPKPLDIDYTIDDHVESLRYTLRDIGVDEPFTLVGYSMGGPIALRYAATYREEVARLVLISAPFFLRPDQIGDDAYAKAVFQSEGSQQVLSLVTSARFEGSGVFKKLSSEESQLIQGFINARDLKTDWQILQRNMANVIQGSDFPADLVRVKAPITFMVGEHDTFIVQSQIQTLRAEYAPSMEVRVLGDLKADHMLLENVPVMMAGEITKWEDRRLAVALDRGEGETFVFLHGIENDGSFWNEVAAAVSTSNRAISLDMLGFGFSPKPLDIPYSVDNQVASICETLDALLAEGTRVTFVGHSLGALVAAGYARRFPDQVRQLVLFVPPVGHDDTEVGKERFDKARATFVNSFGVLRESGAKLSRRSFVRSTLGSTRLDRYEPSLRSIENVIEKRQLADDLSATSVPVTVIAGKRDPMVVPEAVEALAGLREGIEVRVLDSGHDIAHTLPVEAVAAIDPTIDPGVAAAVVEKSKTDRKLRPSARTLSAALDTDALLVGARGLLLMIFGAGLLFLPSAGDLNVLRFAFAAFVFVRAVATITGVFTTHSIRQEQMTSAIMGVVGMALGAFMLFTPSMTLLVLVLYACGYLLVTGVVYLYAAWRTQYSPKRRRRLLLEGSVSAAAALLLLAGSTLVAKLIVAFLTVGSLSMGFALISYALVVRRSAALTANAVVEEE
ncbi:MAG TPA: alpha/beta fold hydrolase [Coriobacteriia bacterium]|nr:alpha/beta fold hydrolase [Coriobacteriia bacterium]